MIRFDGYYVFEPFPYLDKKEENIIEYNTKAFLFQDDGFVNITSKWTRDNVGIFFTKEDFLSKDSLVKYIYKKNEYFYLHESIGKPWESKFYYDEISDEEFASRQTGRVLKFVPWDDHGK